MRRRAALFGVAAAVALVAAACDYVHVPFLGRLDQPVVLTGADLPDLLGLAPGRVVAYRYDARAGQFVQLPVQVDERLLVDFGEAPANNTSPGTVGTVYGTAPIGVSTLQYADPGTFVGADPDPSFDADDELAFLARDAGPDAPAGTPAPAGTVPASGVELALADTGSGANGYVYLFEGVEGSDPSAGKDYVDYDFVLSSGDYRTTYKRADGPNPEQSTVSTYAYSLGMVDRWTTVELRVASSTGVDVLDGLKAQFSFSTCGRSNQTFADAEGAFVANVDGPVRAIRSYVGANSGPLTQETMTFYPDRIELRDDLRVHQISSVLSYVDFADTAVGMRYGNSAMSGTVAIDGVPDTVPSTAPAWEYAAGGQGAITAVSELTTSYPAPALSLDWVDDTTPTELDCWGDGKLYGAAATVVAGPIPNTDPRTPPYETFVARKVLAIWPASLNAAAWTPGWAADALDELDVTVTPLG